MLTGESVPAQKTTGDTVSAGTLNTTGAFSMRATGIGSETLLARIIALVADAQGSKAPIQKLADRISSRFVPFVLEMAFVSLLVWIWFNPVGVPYSQALSFGLISFVNVLIIACPCALGLATPTAIIVGVGRGASQGILIKNAEVLEKLHKVTTLVIDKTGTLTEGKPKVLSVQTRNTMNEAEAMAILASIEMQSEHPIATAIVQYSKDQSITLENTSHFENMPGQGLKAILGGTVYYAGGPNMLSSLNLVAPKANSNQVATIVYLATESEVILSVAIGDQIREGAKEAISILRRMGIKVIMATGDNKLVADSVANELGITEVLAQTLPQDKLAKIRDLQSAGGIVAMAGDGVNDAPALAQSDIGIAMSTGSDVSIETSDVTLLHGDIRKIAQAIKLSKATMSTVRQNLFWAFIYNVIGIPLAGGFFFPFLGWVLSPVFAGFAMAMSSVSVVLNSLRLRVKKL
jgi:heavy metal translocating P-type ATPase